MNGAMIHFLPIPQADQACPGETDGLARFSAMRRALAVLDPSPLDDDDDGLARAEEARAWQGGSDAARACFDVRSEELAAAVATGLEALLAPETEGRQAIAARQRLAVEIRSGLESLRLILRG